MGEHGRGRGHGFPKNAKKPKMALKSIFRIAEGIQNTNTLPMDLSIMKNEASGLLITNPPEVVKKLRNWKRWLSL